LHPLFERRQHRGVEAAPRALVGEGGVGEAVAQDDIAARERRLDHAHDMVAPRREHQQRLGQRIHRLAEDHRAQRFGDRRAAGLARAHDLPAAGLEQRFERIDVARFSGAVDAFERQEQTLHCLLR
jgi:hypothetical protein